MRTRATYTDEQILDALDGLPVEGLPKQTRSRWLKERDEWQAEVAAAAATGRAPVPDTRVARLLASRSPIEGTVLARAHARERIERNELVRLLAGTVAQMLDHEIALYATMPAADRHRLLALLLARYTALASPAEDTGASAPSPFLAIVNQLSAGAAPAGVSAETSGR